jgi:hypothetical protein
MVEDNEPIVGQNTDTLRLTKNIENILITLVLELPMLMDAQLKVKCSQLLLMLLLSNITVMKYYL